ncbi:hypothetical protein [Solemya velum gill symbiont]|uniref:Uncharacterized protein n=1 Tax=Solemya velum gill symbiont TaxID=2340 RepID=A0A1T2P2X3_SOVGS|nr:hypothetical protein [Solemya velum gill symbiont]OOY34747.1 hypothetical protein BOV88_08255 [Solemya velum gill symbiont]OOY37639.1 hypothetical protein BOV89_06220 [Solemya velum gill symbiont]OOY39438.1 hypothetical protein BOV90_09460 [Solemya velum gill symbiont]OOY41879.1 hypothetical protein BOV91_09135 [Solemya velum gill symbiont]OOY45707.1 hypothetical protein BOV92_04570 [Solemya velum gill symbiont]
MELKVIIEDQLYTLNVPEELLQKAAEFFDKMDADMDKGIQMSRQWVQKPGLIERLQLVGNKLLTAIENENENLGRMMAGYILSRAPNIDTIDLDTSGEMQGTEITFKEQAAPVSFGMPPGASMGMDLEDPYGMDPALRENAEKKVSSVFKQGRVYAFSVYNSRSDSWETITVGKDEAEAQRMRDETVISKMLEMAH